MSYTISFNDSKNQVEVQLKTLIDSAALVKPTQFKGEGDFRYSLRCILNNEKSKKFQSDMLSATSKLCNGTTQVHQKLAKNNTNPKYIVQYLLKSGADKIAEAKELDLHAAPGQRKIHNPSYDFWGDLVYFFAKRSIKLEKPVILCDRYGSIMTPESDVIFSPSFIGVVKFVVRRTILKNAPDIGGFMTAYVNAVQFLAPCEINYNSTSIFGESDSDDNLFGDVGIKTDFKKIDSDTSIQKIKSDPSLEQFLDEFA